MTQKEVSAPDKLVALTFDDGPDNVRTRRVMEKLQAYEVPATFFVVGQRVNESTRPILQEMVRLGYELGNHSWDYSSLDSRSAEEIEVFITRTTAAIETYAGMTPAFFRPPNLAVGSVMYETIEYPFAGGVPGYDWAGMNTSAQQRAENVLNNVRDGSIILLHDVQPDPHPTPEALDIIIPELLSQGYEFVTLSELFARKGVDPSSRPTGMWTHVQ
ncbi:MAG: polysaccharide deacetylase family protein [Spirochaeta sp.]